MSATGSRRCASVSARRLPASSNASDRYSPRVGEMAGRAVAREPKEIVARGYDAIALCYAEWAGQVVSPVMEWVRDLDARLVDGSDVLELGCGRCVPATRELARRHRDRKSTRLNSSHGSISYAVFCLRKKRRKPRRSGWQPRW